nr:hypothetical protein [Virgisporangium aurantiacum]
MAPLATRLAPTTRTTRTPVVGRSSTIGSHPAGADVGVAQPGRRVGEQSGLRVTQAERPHDLFALEALVRDRGHLRPHLLRVPQARRHPPLVSQVHGDDERHQHQRDDGQHAVGDDGGGHAGDEHEQHADRQRERHHRRPRGLHVGADGRQHLAGRVAPVPGETQAQVPPGQRAPVAGLQPELGGAGGDPSRHEPADAHQRDADDHRRRRERRADRGFPGGERGRDDVRRHPPEPRRGRDDRAALHDRGEDRRDERAPLLASTTEQAGEADAEDPAGAADRAELLVGGDRPPAALDLPQHRGS